MLQQLFDQFVQQRVYLKNVSPSTQDWYRTSWKAAELEEPLTKATLVAAITRMRDRGISAISVNTYLRCINAFLRWMHEEVHLAEPLKVPRLKEEKKVMPTFSPAQVARRIQFKPRRVAEQRAHTLVCLLFDTGLRISEALVLRREDVDLDNVLLKVNGKGAKQRVVPFSLEMRKILFRWMQRHSGTLVFTTRTGTALTKRNAQRDIRLLAAKLGITGVRISPHTFRHTFA